MQLIYILVPEMPIVFHRVCQLLCLLAAQPKVCLLYDETTVGPGKYDCICPDGRWGERCIPRYVTFCCLQASFHPISLRRGFLVIFRLVEDTPSEEELTGDNENDEEWSSERHNAEFIFFLVCFVV